MKMLIYLDILDLTDFYEYVNQTKMSHELIIKTKCGLITDCLKYLLSFTNKKTVYDNTNKNYLFTNFDKNYGYVLTIDVMNKDRSEKIDPIIDHQFIVINHDNKWYILDGYIDQKEFQYIEIDPMKLSQFVYDMAIKFDIKKWNEIFDVTVQRSDLKYARTVIHRYTWQNSDKMNKKFLDLIKRTRYRLNNEPIGVSDDHLALLNEDLDVNAAKKYLKCLEDLVKIKIY